MNKFKPLAASLLGATLVTSAVLPSSLTANAETKKVQTIKTGVKLTRTGKLISEETGKAINGTVSYKGKVYKNGKKANGILGGIYYKNGKRATGVTKSIFYSNGVKGTGAYKGLYYSKGEKANGLIKGVFYKLGKKASGVYKNVYYKNGKKGSGYYKNVRYSKGMVVNGLLHNVLFKDGKRMNGLVEGVYYTNGHQANGIYDDIYYENGKMISVESILAKLEIKKTELSDSQKAVKELQQQKEGLAAIETKLGTKSATYSIRQLNYEEVDEFIAKYKNVLSFTDEEKLKVQTALTAYQDTVKENLQTEVNKAVKSAEKVVQISSVIATVSKDEKSIAVAQTALELIKEAVKTFNGISEVKVDLASLSKAITKAETALQNNPVKPPIPDESKKPAEQGPSTGGGTSNGNTSTPGNSNNDSNNGNIEDGTNNTDENSPNIDQGSENKPSISVKDLETQHEKKEAEFLEKKSELVGLLTASLNSFLEDKNNNVISAEDIKNYNAAANEFNTAQQNYLDALGNKTNNAPALLKVKSMSEVKSLDELKEMAMAASKKLDDAEKQILIKYEGYENKSLTEFILEKGISYLNSEDLKKLQEAQSEFELVKEELSKAAQQLDEVKSLMTVINNVAAKVNEKLKDVLNSEKPYENFNSVFDNYSFVFKMFNELVTDESIRNQIEIYTKLGGEVNEVGKYRVGFGFNLAVDDHSSYSAVNLYESEWKYLEFTYVDVNAEATRAVDVLFKSHDKEFVASSINEYLINSAKEKVNQATDDDLKTALNSRIAEAEKQMTEEAIETAKRVISNRHYENLPVENFEEATKIKALQNQLKTIGDLLHVNVEVKPHSQENKYIITLSDFRDSNKTTDLTIDATIKQLKDVQ